MFVGHALLAFALVTLIADWRGWPAQRALTLGLVAGSFAALPDIDMAYAALALDVGQLTAESVTQPNTLWDATADVHRSITHSLIVSAIAGPAFGLWASRGRLAFRLAAGVALGAPLVALWGGVYLTDVSTALGERFWSE